ncbi:MAG: hypothetical protein IJ640_08445 [Prevotella sp.]|nr:hypothetical protein [Prevotella sp.]
MDKNDFDKRIDALLVQMLNLDTDFAKVVKDYYGGHPKEKGKKDSAFYQRISHMADEFERRAYNLRQNLKEPDSIQGYQTK